MDQFVQTRVAPNSEAKFETEYHDTEDEEKTISDDDDSCDESDADDEVFAVMSGDDSWKHSVMLRMKNRILTT